MVGLNFDTAHLKEQPQSISHTRRAHKRAARRGSRKGSAQVHLALYAWRSPDGALQLALKLGAAARKGFWKTIMLSMTPAHLLRPHPGWCCLQSTRPPSWPRRPGSCCGLPQHLHVYLRASAPSCTSLAVQSSWRSMASKSAHTFSTCVVEQGCPG